MSKFFTRIASYFSSRTLAGVDKAGNRYFARKEEVDGIVKEKRWVIFKAEEDPISIPVEWICWLNGQRKKAPTLEEMMELETRRERVKLNVARLKKEEEQEKAKKGSTRGGTSTGKVGGPDLKSFIRQYPAASEAGADVPDAVDDTRKSKETEAENTVPPKKKPQPESSEPTGSGISFKPGTWQPPT